MNQSLSSNLSYLEKILLNNIPQTTVIKDVFEFLLKNDFEEIRFSVIKEPRWADDAFILRIIKENDFDLILKIHYDKYPMAAHFYNSSVLLKKLSESKHATDIFRTFTITNSNSHNIRFVFYDYLAGLPLDKLVTGASQEKIDFYRILLKECIKDLMYRGINPFVRDLGDFIVMNEKDSTRVILTDINTLVDCSNSSLWTRREILDIINHVIDQTVVSDYEPFISARPTMFKIGNQ